MAFSTIVIKFQHLFNPFCTNVLGSIDEEMWRNVS